MKGTSRVGGSFAYHDEEGAISVSAVILSGYYKCVTTG